MSDTVFVAICDGCQQVRQFLSEEDRNAWEQTHPHEEDDGENA